MNMLIEDFYIWFLILFVAYFALLFGYMHYSHKSDYFNNLFGFGALFFVFIHVLLFLFLMIQEEYFHKSILPLFLITLGLPMLLFCLISLISTCVFHVYKLIFKTRDFSKFSEKMSKKMKEMKKSKRDTLRKISHVLMFVGLFLVWYIGYDIVKHSGKRWAGMNPKSDNMVASYRELFFVQESIRSVLLNMGWFYFLIFFVFYIFCLFLLFNEYTRKSKNFAFPFNLWCSVLLTDDEKESYGTYLYFGIGQLFAAFLCPPMVFFAILGISSIADLMASQIGIRFGKNHILWNKNKTWEGTVSSSITAFVICFFFVGVIWALIFTITYLIFDIFTDKPLDLSDNLLTPIGCALIYIFIRYFFDVAPYSLLLEWI